MKKLAILVGMLAFGGCGGSPSKPAKTLDLPKVYSMGDVDQELRQAGVQLGSTPADVHAFFTAHPAYRVCKDLDDAGLVAMLSNKRADPKADDQYIVVAYRDGKVSNLDIGPPQFSAGNVASYCK